MRSAPDTPTETETVPKPEHQTWTIPSRVQISTYVCIYLCISQITVRLLRLEQVPESIVDWSYKLAQKHHRELSTNLVPLAVCKNDCSVSQKISRTSYRRRHRTTTHRIGFADQAKLEDPLEMPEAPSLPVINGACLGTALHPTRLGSAQAKAGCHRTPHFVRAVGVAVHLHDLPGSRMVSLSLVSQPPAFPAVTSWI